MNYDMIKLDNQLCFPLYALSRKIIKLYKPLLDKHNLTYTQYIVMMVMWEHSDITFRELGKKLHLDSGTLTPVVKKLSSMGFIERKRSEADERVLDLSITRKGLELKAQILDVPEGMMCHFRGKEVDLTKLKELLDSLLKDLTVNLD